MSKVLTTKTKLIVKQTCSLIAGVIVCIYIFIPLFSSLSARLFLLVASGENYTLLLFTRSMLEAVAFCVSGFLTGLIISSFSTNREIRTTVLGSLIVITFVVIKIGFIPLRFGGSEVHKAYPILEMVVYAICLLGFAIIGAWLVARRRHLQVQKASK
jgi:hypothetical protein